MSSQQQPEVKMEVDSSQAPFYSSQIPFYSSQTPFYSSQTLMTPFNCSLPLQSQDSPYKEIQRPLTLHCKLLENPDISIPREDCYQELSRYLRIPSSHRIPQLLPPPRYDHNLTCSDLNVTLPELDVTSPECWRRVALDTLIHHLPILIPDMTRIFREEQSHRESLLLTLFEFAQLFFADPVALIKTLFLRNSGAEDFIVTFRILLNVASLSIKEQAVKVLLRMLETYGVSGKAEDDSVPSIVGLILNADLDHCLVRCLHLNEKPLFNDVIQVLQLLMTSTREFSPERVQRVLEESLRVTHLTICDEGLERDAYFKFLWTAFKTLEFQQSLPTSFELRVMALFDTLLSEPKDWEPQVLAHFGEFARRVQHPEVTLNIRELYNKFMTQRSLGILLKLLDVPVVRQPLAQHLIGSHAFLKSLQDGIECRDKTLPLQYSLDAYGIARILSTAIDCPGYPLTALQKKQRIFWKLSRFCLMLNAPHPVITHAWIPMVKLFTTLLKTDFNNRLVKIVEVESEEPTDTDRLRNPLNQIIVALQNLGLRMRLTEEEDELIWESLLEHHKYTMRRYVEETRSVFDPPSPPFYKDHLFRKSTQYFLRSYLARSSALEVSETCLDFLEDYVKYLGKEFGLDGRAWRAKRVAWNGIRRLLDAVAEWLAMSRRDGPGLDLNVEEQKRNAYVLRITFKIRNFGNTT